MKNKLNGYLKLSRFNEYVYFVIVTTLLGISAAQGEFNWRFILVLIGNWLSVGFAFMINDVEDAPDDALNADKINRNPVSAGILTPLEARIASFIVALISAIFFAFLGWRVFIFGLISLLLGVAYSYHGLRLKKRAFLDLATHGWLLAGLQMVTGYFAFSDHATQTLIFPLLFVICVSLYGELFNELRDLEGDRKANLRHTAIVIGEKATQILMFSLLFLGVLSGVVTFFFLDIIPLWVVILMAILALILILPTLLKLKGGQSSLELQTPFHKPLERAAAIALMVNFLAPFLLRIFGK